jgi:phosphatidylglycerol:prolipoprotein diacylglycerol transferase
VVEKSFSQLHNHLPYGNTSSLWNSLYGWKAFGSTLTKSRHGIIDGVVAFYLPGGVAVYTFALILGAAASLGLAWTALEAPRRQVLPALNAGLCALAGGLAGARLAHVAAHWSYFQEHGLELVQIQQGGLAWPGALAGGLLGIAIYAGLSHQNSGALADLLIPLGTAVAVSAWMACWLDGCAYGAPASGWWGLPARDEWGEWGRRIPVQLLGALLSLGIYALVQRARAFMPVPGQAALLAVLLFSAGMFALSWLRYDPAPLAGLLRLEAWAALVFCAGAAGLWLATWLRGRAVSKNGENLL